MIVIAAATFQCNSSNNIMTTPTKQDPSSRVITPADVRANGRLTLPPSYGVYELPAGSGATCRYRFGNHPVRQTELHREFGSCKLLYLFEERSDAVQMASMLNEGKAQ